MTVDNLISVFANYPCDGSFRLWFGVFSDLFDQVFDKLFILVGESSEDILSNYNCLLKSYWLSILYYLLNNLYRKSYWSVNFQDDLPNRSNGSLNKIHIHVIWVVLKFVEYAFTVSINNNLNQNFDLFQFQVQRIIELTEENFDAVFEDSGLFLQNKVYVP